MPTACWAFRISNIAIPPQKGLYESVSMLLHTFIASLEVKF